MKVLAWLILLTAAVLAAPHEARLTFLERPEQPPFRNSKEGSSLYQLSEQQGWLLQLAGTAPPFLACAGSGHGLVMPYDLPLKDSGSLEVIWAVPPGTRIVAEGQELPGNRARLTVKPGLLPALWSNAPGEYTVELWQDGALILHEDYRQRELVAETTVENSGDFLAVACTLLWSDGEPVSTAHWKLTAGGGTGPQTLSGLGDTALFDWLPATNTLLGQTADLPRNDAGKSKPGDEGTVDWTLEATTLSGLHPCDLMMTTVHGTLPARQRVYVIDQQLDRQALMPGPPITYTATIVAGGYGRGPENLIIGWELEVIGPSIPLAQTVRTYGQSVAEAAEEDGRDRVEVRRTWDGRDTEGREVPPGEYNFRLTARAGVPVAPRPSPPLRWFYGPRNERTASTTKASSVKYK